MPFALTDLYAIMRDVFGLRKFQFEPTMSAPDVPGWNSLNHTVLLMEIEQQLGVELSAAETIDMPDIATLHRAIVERLRTQGASN
jgi:acyl carrier protein